MLLYQHGLRIFSAIQAAKHVISSFYKKCSNQTGYDKKCVVAVVSKKLLSFYMISWDELFTSLCGLLEN